MHGGSFTTAMRRNGGKNEDGMTRRFKMHTLIWVLLIGLVCTPPAAWTFYKPTRVLVPQWNGVSCFRETICTDDASRYKEALALYDEAYTFVHSSVGAIEQKPRVIFCASHACFRSFGFDKAAAHTVGISGIVISPRGWKDHYIRHEMIHHLQAERLGVFGQWRSPAWLTEGMAFVLSQDPRPDLGEPRQQDRAAFEKWYQTVGKARLWEEARGL